MKSIKMYFHPVPLAVCTALAAMVLLASGMPTRAEDETTPPAGLRENTPYVDALVGGKVVISPRQTLEQGTLVLRNGVIVAVGEKVEIPADARVWDVAGKTIYPGFIDSYAELGKESGSPDPAGYWNHQVTPQRAASGSYEQNADQHKQLRRQGVVAQLVAPAQGIIKGTSLLVTTGDGSLQQNLLHEPAALHLQLQPVRGKREEDQAEQQRYPNSPMGAVALVRQALYDARWYGSAWQAYQAGQGNDSRPEKNLALDALAELVESDTPFMVEASDELYFLRAQQLAEEFDLPVVVRGSGKEYRRLDAVAASKLPVVAPLNFPLAPYVKVPELAQAVTLERLMHWDLAPENPARLAKAGVPLMFTSFGLKSPSEFLKQLRFAVYRGLPPEAALAALTETPARTFGVEKRLGTLEVGKAASLVVADGEIFADDTQILETWIDGVRYADPQTPLLDVRGTWQVSIAPPDQPLQKLTLLIGGKPHELSARVDSVEPAEKLASIQLDATQLTGVFAKDALEFEGIVRFSVAVDVADEENPSWLGSIHWADGTSSPLTAKRTKAYEPAQDPFAKNNKAEEENAVKDDTAKPEEQNDKPKDKEQPNREPHGPRRALFAPNFPLGAFGRAEAPQQAKVVAFINATIWTCGPDGILPKGTLLIRDGKIAAVGAAVDIPSDAEIIDLEGRHVTPGIIDCHSHIATDGGVNESGQTITAEVRIGDFVDANDIQIYRQLAGGVTCANILHGSANTIGGQNQVIKFRWGELPEALKVADAPPGIKFALGENVKQSNWGEKYTTRYPQTRMGVEQLVRDAFAAAKRYELTWRQWRHRQQGVQPRVDLELEALAEVLAGDRLIHCHSYRQDEILALLRTCEDYGVRIATLQHVLEGYKVADAIQKHGAGGSAFSDWWAYKFEVFDAIPYNGALMHGAGVVVSFNSDDPELARRLNVEAAKAVRYGGLSEAESFKFVTLNPAKQLGIEHRVGSLEHGKDADLVVWSRSPLSTRARCEETWIEGRRYFSLAEDQEQRTENAARHAQLVQRALSSKSEMEDPAAVKKDLGLWPRRDIYCTHDQQR